LNDSTTRELVLADIEDRKAASTSIMLEGPVKTPRELRDLLAYLLTHGPRRRIRFGLAGRWPSRGVPAHRWERNRTLGS
jgi:hypothetical protein